MKKISKNKNIDNQDLDLSTQESHSYAFTTSFTVCNSAAADMPQRCQYQIVGGGVNYRKAIDFKSLAVESFHPKNKTE